MTQGVKSFLHEPGNPCLPSRTRTRMLSSDLHMDGCKCPSSHHAHGDKLNLEVSFEKLIIVPGEHLFTVFSEGK